MYYSFDAIRKNEIGGAYRTYGGTGACSILVGKPHGKRPLGRPRYIWYIILKCSFKK
jgi:hypothetical protein